MLSSNDHRRLGQELDLFHLQEEAPGSVFWHPRGLELFRAIEEHVRRVVSADGYREVKTPQLVARPIWESSGHWSSFAAGMVRLDLDEREAALKPVNCPCHLQIVLRACPSYRDLPIRLSELGLVHRNEPSGVLHGLFRLRQFTQDDGHVFCAEEQVHAELVRFLARVRAAYASFGFSKVDVALSTRPAVRAGDDEVWDRAERALERAAAEVGFGCRIQPGEGAFYGPKLEIVLSDHAGRSWQCGTVQLDYFMAPRFGASYVAADGSKKPLVMIHRALLGSVERFAGILLEHHAGWLPAWLSPESAIVLPIGEAQAAYAAELALALRRRGVRAISGSPDGTLSRRVRDAYALRIPFVAVVGAREVEARSVVLRRRMSELDDTGAGERASPLSFDAACDLLVRECSVPSA